MNLKQANIIVEAFIRQAQDLQNLAIEEDNAQVREFLLVESSRQSQAAAKVPSLPLSY